MTLASSRDAHGLSGRPTVARIDLSAIAANYRRLCELAGDGRIVYPVIKADGYGHGASAIARRLEAEGARHFAVAILEEGISLRRAGISREILLLNHCDPGEAHLCLAYGLVPTLWSLGHAAEFARAAESLAAPLRVQLKIDSGMGRLGVAPHDVGEAADLLRRARGLSLIGTFTQLARADEADPAPTLAQLSTFSRCIETLRAARIDPGTLHAANSAGLLRHPESLLDAVRPGIALYGIPPVEGSEDAGIFPAMTLETRVLTVQRIRAGDAIGYGGAWMARRASTIAVLPIGYHDGVRRSFSSRVGVILRGRKAPIVGAVSMDLTLVDATDCGAAPGDRALLLGSDGALRVTAWDLARAAGTIPYEIVCGIGPRVPRVHS